MSDASSLSNLSSTSSRSEHMKYLMDDLKLDKPAAMLMYRAERLQEKGQLQQALRYFERVLSSSPDCDEAVVNARMIREQLSEQAPSLPAIGEHEAAATAASQPESAPGPQPPCPWQTVDMQVVFEEQDCEQYESYHDEASLNEAALDEARRRLKNHNISTPFLKLVSNDIRSYTLPVHIDPWLDTRYKCDAIVRVTFPSNAPQSSSAPAVASDTQLEALLTSGLLAELFGGQVASTASGQNQNNAFSSGSYVGEPEAELSACGHSNSASHFQKEEPLITPATSMCAAAADSSEVQSMDDAATGTGYGAGALVPLPSLHLLEYSRTPECFHRMLLGCPELSECIGQLTARGFAVQRESGLKIFVSPEMYNQAVAAVELHGEEQLRSRHIVASDQFVDVVRTVLAKLPKKHQVNVKAETAISPSFPAEQDETTAAAEEVLSEEANLDVAPIEIKHTFLHVNVPSSIYSGSSSMRTARTAPASCCP